MLATIIPVSDRFSYKVKTIMNIQLSWHKVEVLGNRQLLGQVNPPRDHWKRLRVLNNTWKNETRLIYRREKVARFQLENSGSFARTGSTPFNVNTRILNKYITAYDCRIQLPLGCSLHWWQWRTWLPSEYSDALNIPFHVSPERVVFWSSFSKKTIGVSFLIQKQFRIIEPRFIWNLLKECS